MRRFNAAARNRARAKSDAIVGRYLKQADRLKTNAHRLPGVGLDSTRQR